MAERSGWPRAADGGGDWEEVGKRDTFLIQKPLDSDDDEGSEMSF